MNSSHSLATTAASRAYNKLPRLVAVCTACRATHPLNKNIAAKSVNLFVKLVNALTDSFFFGLVLAANTPACVNKRGTEQQAEYCFNHAEIGVLVMNLNTMFVMPITVATMLACRSAVISNPALPASTATTAITFAQMVLLAQNGLLSISFS